MILKTQPRLQLRRATNPNSRLSRKGSSRPRPKPVQSNPPVQAPVMAPDPRFLTPVNGGDLLLCVTGVVVSESRTGNLRLSEERRFAPT